MNDKYPRVFHMTPDTFRTDAPIGPVPGSLKVVPADAIVIERGDLPIVADRGTPGFLYIGDDRRAITAETPDRLVDEIRARVALAEYLSAHPPVDEARVSELHHVIQTHVSANVTRTGALSILRDLEARGWTKPGVES